MTIALSPGAIAQDRDARDAAVIEEARERFGLPVELSDAELKTQLAAYLDRREAEYQERRRNETVDVGEVVGGASVVARCAEGYVTGRRVQRSADDVEIASEERVDCDTEGCKALQVNAQRPNDAPFSVTVSVSCSG